MEYAWARKQIYVREWEGGGIEKKGLKYYQKEEVRRSQFSL